MTDKEKIEALQKLIDSLNMLTHEQSVAHASTYTAESNVDTAAKEIIRIVIASALPANEEAE